MIKLNISEAKTHLSQYLTQLAKGETILLCKRNKPIAEIRRLPERGKKKRPIGLAKGQIKISSDFFEPLPPEVIDGFYGKNT